MWPARAWAPRFWNARYWCKVGAGAAAAGNQTQVVHFYHAGGHA